MDRILGQPIHLTNYSKERSKPIETIHKILGDSLDNFFTESEKKYKNKEKNITIHTPTQMRDNLNEFFKKTDVSRNQEKGFFYFPLISFKLIINTKSSINQV